MHIHSSLIRQHSQNKVPDKQFLPLPELLILRQPKPLCTLPRQDKTRLQGSSPTESAIVNYSPFFLPQVERAATVARRHWDQARCMPPPSTVDAGETALS